MKILKKKLQSDFPVFDLQPFIEIKMDNYLKSIEYKGEINEENHDTFGSNLKEKKKKITGF